jgi:carboxyl-terminal processing protease
MVVLALSIGGAAVLPLLPAGTQAQPQVVSAEQLKLKAIEAVRSGKFEQSYNYLNQAAGVSKDPVLVKMAAWAKQFEEQRQVFAGERRREYEKAVKQIQTLREKSKPTYAMEVAAFAYPLAEDKDAYRREPWMVQLLSETKKLADESDKTEQWVKSLRLYSQLSIIEPEVPDWKEKLKTATRRVTLLATYAPEEWKKIQTADAKEREEIDPLLNPDAKPATKPTTKPADEEAENHNRFDWREALRDVRMDMLSHGLVNARANYYRSVGYQQMMLGGLNALRVVLTMPALETSFPDADLANAGKRAEFLGVIDALIARAGRARPQEEAELAQVTLRELKEQNDRTVRLPEAALVNEFASGAFGALDPFSSIIWPSDWEEFQKTTKGEFSGVGIQIQTDDVGNLKVVTPLEDSPAYKAGIKPDWIITHIDGKSARWLLLNQAVKRITGPPGTPVTLTIKDTQGNVREYTLRRDTIKVASIKGWIHRPGGGWDYFVDPEQKIGYIRMTNFTKTTAEDLDRAVDELTRAGARGLLLDLRYNPGGLLNAATDVVDKFISDGLIVSTRPDRPDSPNLPTEIKGQARNNETRLPLIVLVNQFSASASEIVSGALKDHKRALIVGDRTFGKGSVQMLYPLGNQQAVLKLTTSHYYLPNGKCIHREENSKDWGVDPDVTVEMTPAQNRTAIDARQDLDILRDETPAPAGAPANADPAKRKDPLTCDAQLSAALLLMRLHLAGGDELWAQAGSALPPPSKVQEVR